MTAKITATAWWLQTIWLFMFWADLFFSFMYSENCTKHAVQIRGLFAVALFQYIAIQGRGECSTHGFFLFLSIFLIIRLIHRFKLRTPVPKIRYTFKGKGIIFLVIVVIF